MPRKTPLTLEQRARNAANAKAWRQRNPEKWKAYYPKAKAWMLANPERVKINNRNGWLKRNYGITIQDWESIFDAQGRRCPICKSVVPKTKHGWVVDHNHKTGAVRNILCQPCNILVGLAEEDVAILRSAAEYLERHR